MFSSKPIVCDEFLKSETPGLNRYFVLYWSKFSTNSKQGHYIGLPLYLHILAIVSLVKVRILPTKNKNNLVASFQKPHSMIENTCQADKITCEGSPGDFT